MGFRIDDIKSNLEFGGARPSLFNIELTFPTELGIAGRDKAEKKIQFLAKAAQLPPSNMGVVEVPYFGRKIKVAGNRTFPEWTITIINDEDFAIRSAFEGWLQSINSHSDNLRVAPDSRPLRYKSQAKVRQYGKDETLLKKYQFQGVFPSEISEIALDWNSTDEIQEFTVTLQYDLWEIDQSPD